ncbi:MAG TPA: AarF/UbiB family protein [Pyrinomonadaceae bacterium]|nr:AarF/UbiB family protein [Pyrinomonadaceae bacterium]
MRRIAHLLAVLIRHAVAQGLAISVRRWPKLSAYVAVADLSGPQRLRSLIEDMGGTFIKFGQMLALQPDILPLEYCNALFDLLDRVSPFPFAQVEKLFIEEFGKSPRDTFDEFETRPMATASIGQVHVAYLSGRKLAVKVQRPDVDADFKGDIRLMIAAIRLIKRLRLKRLYWMIEPTSEFVAWTDEELDYRREARYMEQHRLNAQHNSHERVPEVFREFLSRRVLVAEFIEGVNVLDYLRALETNDKPVLDSLKDRGFEGSQFVYNVLENFLGDAYRFGMFHADLHPANLLILPGNTVGYIDFGITGVLSRYSRQNVVSLTRALGRGDLDGMCAAFFKISTLNTESDVEGFREGMTKLAKEWYEVQGKKHRLVMNATLVMLDMLKLSHRTGIYPERDVVKYIRSAIAIDGLITRVAPEFDLGRHLELICNRQLKWHARLASFTPNTMIGLAGSSGHMMQDGVVRASRSLSRLATGEFPVYAEISKAKDGNEDYLRGRALRLASVVCLISALVAVTGENANLGVNLFTAEVMFVATAAFMLIGTMRRLAQDRHSALSGTRSN